MKVLSVEGATFIALDPMTMTARVVMGEIAKISLLGAEVGRPSFAGEHWAKVVHGGEVGTLVAFHPHGESDKAMTAEGEAKLALSMVPPVSVATCF